MGSPKSDEAEVGDQEADAGGGGQGASRFPAAPKLGDWPRLQAGHGHRATKSPGPRRERRR